MRTVFRHLYCAFLPFLAACEPSWSDAPRGDASEDPWELTVYYTAVESFHSDPRSTVRGCLDSGCETRGEIGRFPESFAEAVKNEGTGRITSGARAGMVLNWSGSVGYWLDSVPRNAQGGALIPWVSAAANEGTLPYGTRLRIRDCGTHQWAGLKIDGKVCAALQRAEWVVTDRFEPGHGAGRHLDLYVGEEDLPRFTSESPKFISTRGARIRLMPPLMPQ